MEIHPRYLAGFFDGEGTFKVSHNIKKSNGKKYPHATILLSQSGEDGRELLEKIRREYGGNLYLHISAGQHKATKPAYKLYWNKAEAILLIKDLLPYLILKKQAAQEVLEYLERDIAKELL